MNKEINHVVREIVSELRRNMQRKNNSASSIFKMFLVLLQI